MLHATMLAHLHHARPSLVRIALAGGIPEGSLKAARSRLDGLRTAMDSVGRRADENALYRPNLDDEIAVLASWWRSRPLLEREAWTEAAGCPVLHRAVEAATAASDAGEKGPTLDELFALVPGRTMFETLWGEQAWQQVELLDTAHRLVDDPPEWAAA